MAPNQGSVVSRGQAKQIGEYLKLRRTAAGMSYHDLSVASGVGKDYIWRIETGAWKRVGGQVWAKLARALGTTTDDLMNCGAKETDIHDPELIRVPLSGEGGFVYVSQRDLKVVDGSRLLALSP